ncbi:unnamed protein product, partial [Candidula unifasciata]
MRTNDYGILSTWISQTGLNAFILILLSISCAHADVYINQFAVHITGGHHAADRVARETGLKNLGQ